MGASPAPARPGASHSLGLAESREMGTTPAKSSERFAFVEGALMRGRGGKTGLRVCVCAAALAAAIGEPGSASAGAASEIGALKAALKRLEARLALEAEAVHRREIAAKAPPSVAPPPVFVGFKNGLSVETQDKSFEFKIGGRIHVDGGFSSSAAETIRRSNFGFRRAELELNGRAFGNWLYRFQYDFATATGGNALRDAYVAYRDTLLPAGLSAQPVSIQLGNFHEPFGLEALESDKHMTFMERGFPANISPARHIGAAIGVGDARWAVKAGLFSTSPQDTATAPPLGGAQYWDAAARAIYAPVREDRALLHVGAAFVYHRPNSSTAATDANDLLPGMSTYERELTGILGSGGVTVRVPPAQDLSCAASASIQRPSCLKYAYRYGFEAVAAHGPVSVQAEYVGARYERDAALILLYGNGGGSSLHYSAYYALVSLFLTGESRAASYDGYDRNWSSPGTFSDVKIGSPVNEGGYGAFEVAVRYTGVDLNNGGLVPASYVYQAAATGSAAQKALASTATLGGRQEDLTLALNWYPARGVRLQANWSRAMKLIPPSDRAYLIGAHTSLFMARAQVFW